MRCRALGYVLMSSVHQLRRLLGASVVSYYPRRGRATARHEQRDRWRPTMLRRCLILAALGMTLALGLQGPAQAQDKKFEVVEATIADIQNAIRAKQIT